MKESVVHDFFAGRATARELAAEVVGAMERYTDSAGARHSRLRSIVAPSEFEVGAEHLLRLLDAVESGDLDLEALDTVCFCVEASDSFSWDADETEDGRRVAEALFLLGTPEINYPLTPVVLGKIRHLLLTGENTFTRDDLAPRGPRPHLISERRWERAPDV
jgi:hypothetical protein